MFGASKTNSASTGGGTDPYFYDVTMLLTGNGTNGAQNNTFLDSSSNNFTITRNGNTTQGSFSPYGSLWSNYFGSGNSLYISTGSVFSLNSDFTIEAWVYLNNVSASGGYAPRLISIGGGINISFSTTTVIVDNNGSAVLTSNSGAISLNNWIEVAVVRNGSTLTIYVNGTSVGSTTYSSTFSDSGNARIGRVESSGGGYLNGYISNLRLVKGTAVYTSNFTPSTTPLTAITNTQLLTCQSNRFIDNSANAITLTPSGTPSVERFSPFNPTASYDTATIGGSGYFDRSSTISTSTNSNLVLTGNFTIEGWYYWNSFTSYQTLFALYSDNAYIQSTGSGGSSFSTDGAFGLGTVISNAKQYQWYHVAICRTGSTLSCFVNGVRTATTTNSNSIGSSGNTLIVGGQNTTSWIFDGYVSDFRIVKGTDVYGASNTSITIPTAPLTAITNTQLLNNFTNAGIPDSAMMNDLETVGNAQVSTSVSKFGTGSLAFDGTGDYLLSPDKQASYFGTGNFTLECWLKTSSTSSYKTVLCPATVYSTSGFYNFIVRSDNTIAFEQGSGSTLVQSTTQVTDGNWHHVAVCRSGTTTRVFVDGVLEGTLNSDTYSYGVNSVGFYVGTYAPSIYNFNGYIDDLRITKGYARYTANFTPPTSALPTY